MNNSIKNKNLSRLKSEKLDWNLVQIDIKNKLGSDIYESWLKKIVFVEEFNNYILLSVPTRFIRDWITSRYLDQILQSVKNHRKEIIRIEFTIIEQNSKDDQNKDILNSLEKQNNFKENISLIKDSNRQYKRKDPNKKCENLITSSSKELAYEA